MKIKSVALSIILGFFIVISDLLFLSPPSQAFTEFSCPISSPNNPTTDFTFSYIPENWKRVFPFDLVYPISPIPTTPLESNCTSFEVFGYTRCLETPKMIAQGVKNIVLIKLAIDLIIAL